MPRFPCHICIMAVRYDVHSDGTQEFGTPCICSWILFYFLQLLVVEEPLINKFKSPSLLRSTLIYTPNHDYPAAVQFGSFSVFQYRVAHFFFFANLDRFSYMGLVM